MNNYEEQIAQLNERVKVRIAPSKTHGVGIFALRYLYRGEKLYGDNMPVLYTLPYDHFYKLLPEVRDILLERWPLIAAGSRFAYPDTRLTAYMNHDDNPNYDAVNDVTLREIEAGEEVFEDYRQIASYEQVFPWLVLDSEKHVTIEPCLPIPVSSVKRNMKVKTKTHTTVTPATKKERPLPRK